MNAFVAIAVLSTLLVLLAVLRPLWRDSPALVAGAALALCLATLAMYRLMGTPAAIGQVAASAAEPGMPATLEEAIARLQGELERNPAQPEGWLLLGKSLAAQGRAAEAGEAYAQAATQLPDNPDVLVEAAQARLYAAADRKLDAQAIAWVRHALEVQPGHQRATWLLGISQRQAGRPADAAATWESLLAQVDAATAAPLREQIDAARLEAGLPALAGVAPAPPVAAGAHPGTVKVSLDPDFAARVRLRGDTTVFVIARLPGGPPMPVAAQKHALQDLPLSVVLDDGDSPMPTQKLSALKEVELIARLSASGDPMRQPGDIESAPVRVALPAKAAVELVLGKPAQ